MASAIEDTQEVMQARAEFMAAFERAQAGQHADLAPEPVANAYLADNEDVAKAKAEFMQTFEDVKAGKVAVPTAQAALPVVAYNAPYYYNSYYPYHFNYYNHYGAYNYPLYYNNYYHHNLGYPFVYPAATVVKAAESQ